MKITDLISKIEIEMAAISGGLVNGYPTDYAKYQRMVGEVQGLNKALMIINELLEEKKQ